jgi:predicted transcriptional regulator
MRLTLLTASGRALTLGDPPPDAPPCDGCGKPAQVLAGNHHACAPCAARAISRLKGRVTDIDRVPLLLADGPLTAGEVAIALGINHSEASRKCRTLVQRGRISAIGEAPSRNGGKGRRAVVYAALGTPVLPPLPVREQLLPYAERSEAWKATERERRRTQRPSRASSTRPATTERLLGLLAEAPATRGEAADRLGVARQTVGKALAALMASGEVVMVGEQAARNGGGPHVRVYGLPGTPMLPPLPPRAPKAKATPRKPDPLRIVPTPKADRVREDPVEAARRAEILTALTRGPLTHAQLVSELYRDRHDTLRRLGWLVKRGTLRRDHHGVYRITDHQENAA